VVWQGSAGDRPLMPINTCWSRQRERDADARAAAQRGAVQIANDISEDPGSGVEFRHDGSILHRSSDGSAHIYGHSVVEEEVEDVLARPMEDRAGRDGSRIALGQTEAGRYLRVIYVPDPTPWSVFVITAYELREKARKTL
jgi:hypothetical protein